MKHHQIAHETSTLAAYLNIFWIGDDDIQFRAQPYANEVSVLLYQLHDKIKVFWKKKNFENAMIEINLSTAMVDLHSTTIGIWIK